MASRKEHPQPVVGALVARNGKILLITSGKKWAHPITAIEFGEEPLDAVRRLLGEFAIRATPAGLIGVHNIIRQDIERYEWEFAKEHLVCLEYLCTAKSEKVLKDHLAERVKWATVAEARRLPLQHYTEELLLMYRPKAKRPARPWTARIRKK